MNNEVAVAANRRKAVLIDDAYLRPSPEDFRRSLQPLRRYLRGEPEAKAWFDAAFGLSGSPMERNYFEPLLSDPKRTVELWERRRECPESQRLLDEGLADLVAEVAPLRLPLEHVEETLTAEAWEIVRFGTLPDPTAVPEDASLVVIDYVLTPDTPADMSAMVDESTQFLQALVERSSLSVRRLPLIVLVSSRPNVAKHDAEAFRKAVGLHGGYFHFIRKVSVLQELGPRIDGFTAEVAELESYRRVHSALRDSLASACQSLQSGINALELQDLAALHVGHLIHEGEPLSDYVGWLLGQALTVKLQESVALAEESGRLPPENHRVLLGHLEPTQGIPKLFCEASTVRTASGQRHKETTGSRKIQFGDIFVVRIGGGIDASRFHLVLSQTCDLLQGKITNGQVLCAEGRGAVVNSSEADLMRATLRQLDDKGSTLIRHIDGTYYQVEWSEVNLVTIGHTILKRERGHRYVGRLNEIYALEVQHKALNKLGRIGVPIKPGYGLVFGAMRLRFWGPKAELTALARSFDNKTVTAVLRPLPKNLVAILLSAELKKWIVEQLEALPATAPAELVGFSKELVTWIKTDEDFRLLCKQAPKGTLQLGVTLKKEENGQTVTSTSWQNKLSLAVGDTMLFSSAVVPSQGLRIQIEVDPIS
jgi:hypothetical protein